MKVLIPGMGVAATLALLSPSTQAAIIGVEVPSRTGYSSCAIADPSGNPLGQISLPLSSLVVAARIDFIR